LNIGGDGDLEHMQKCLGELLDEENECQSLNTVMADEDIKSNISFKKISDPVTDDLGKYILNHVYTYYV